MKKYSRRFAALVVLAIFIVPASAQVRARLGAPLASPALLPAAVPASAARADASVVRALGVFATRGAVTALRAEIGAAGLPSSRPAAALKNKVSGPVPALEALLDRPAAAVSFDGARERFSDVDAVAVKPAGVLSGPRLSARRSVFVKSGVAAGILPVALPTIAMAAELGKAAARNPAFLTAVCGLLGAMSGVLSSIFIVGVVELLLKRALDDRSFNRIISAGGAIGLVAATLGSALGAAAFNGVMIFLLAPIPLCALAVAVLELTPRKPRS